MPGFHTPRQQSPIRQPNDVSHLKRRALTPRTSRPGTPDPVESEIMQHANLPRPTTPFSIRSRKTNEQTPRLSPDGHKSAADLKRWSLVWDGDKEDFVTVPCTDSPGSVNDKLPEDIDVLDEFVFFLEESTPMLESYDNLDAFTGPLIRATTRVITNITNNEQDPDSSFLEFEEW